MEFIFLQEMLEIFRWLDTVTEGQTERKLVTTEANKFN